MCVLDLFEEPVCVEMMALVPLFLLLHFSLLSACRRWWSPEVWGAIHVSVRSRSSCIGKLLLASEFLLSLDVAGLASLSHAFASSVGCLALPAPPPGRWLSARRHGLVGEFRLRARGAH